MQFKTIALVVLLLSTVGCGPGTFTLGGWTESPSDPNARATFGGNLIAIDSNNNGIVADIDPTNTFAVMDPGDTFRGQFQYNDHGPNGVAFHAKITGGYVVRPGPQGIVTMPWRPSNSLFESSAYFEGTYTPVPANLGPGGKFEVLILDDAAATYIDVDKIWIYLEGGVFDGYTNVDLWQVGRDVEAGTVRFHPAR